MRERNEHIERDGQPEWAHYCLLCHLFYLADDPNTRTSVELTSPPGLTLLPSQAITSKVDCSRITLDEVLRA